jgi:hypothetical protein
MITALKVPLVQRVKFRSGRKTGKLERRLPPSVVMDKNHFPGSTPRVGLHYGVSRVLGDGVAPTNGSSNCRDRCGRSFSLVHVMTSMAYSSRRAIVGSRREARRAGRRLPMAAAAASAIAAAPSRKGSRAEMPNSIDVNV